METKEIYDERIKEEKRRTKLTRAERRREDRKLFKIKDNLIPEFKTKGNPIPEDIFKEK